MKWQEENDRLREEIDRLRERMSHLGGNIYDYSIR